MMDEKTRDVITAIGAIGEVCGLMRDQLMKNGFSRKEALTLVEAYIKTAFQPTKNKEEI